MRQTLLYTLSTAALLLVAAPLRADTLKVPAQFETIQAAIDAAGIDQGKSAVTINGRYQELHHGQRQRRDHQASRWPTAAACPPLDGDNTGGPSSGTGANSPS
jgi:hypothetical protein